MHDKNKSWSELGLKDKEEKLLSVEQCIALANSKYAERLKMDGSSSEDDFFIKQPFNLNKKSDYVARFFAVSDRADLDCGGSPLGSDSGLGVRFIREKIRVKK